VRRTTVLLALLLGLVSAPRAAAAGFTLPLPIPPVETGSDITIHARTAPVQIVDGLPATEMWTFDGSFPGPTIRRPAGAQTKVTFVNDLPSGSGDLSIHNHGEHAASADDGQPDDELIAPAAQKTYTYDLTENGTSERAALQWYHDHRLDVTGRNVWNGLAGMFIVDDPVDAALNLPSGARDVPLMIADRTLTATGVLTYPGLAEPPFDTFAGDKTLVNGVYQPVLGVVDVRYRLRLLNASNSRVMKFSLSDGREMTQIATESGLLPAAVTRTEVELAPAERAEVVVDFEGAPAQVMLRADGEDVLRFDVDDQNLADPSWTPAGALRALPDLGTSTRERSFGLGTVEQSGHLRWGIAGKTFDHTRLDAEPKLGTTETWTFQGANGTHVVHIHGTDFQVLSRTNGGVTAPPEAWEAGLKETILVHPKEKVVVKLRFTDHLGKFLFHCHVLEHEDNGMMAQYEVTADGDAPDEGVDPIPQTPGAGTQTETGTQTSSPPPAGTPDLALSWTAPKRLAARSTAKLRLTVRSTGTAATSPATLAVRLTGGLTAGRKRRAKASVTIPALEPGATKTVRVAVHVPRRPRSAKVLATLGSHRATVAYRRSGRALRRSGATASAAALLCRLGT
jgi:FtsP/CotA-like multicopper oxidase with cupredoxin domain